MHDGLYTNRNGRGDFVRNAIWFALSAVMLVIGLFLKKSSIVEKGPTGKLAILVSTE